MGAPTRRRAELAGRAPMRSPGRPPVARREERHRFWAAIADGVSSEEAGVVSGVSPAVGVRWFREGGGMPSVSQAPLSGRYLSFAEREEIAILNARDCGVREIARRLGRSPSTISREGTSQRRDSWRLLGLPGHDRPVARRPTGAAPEGREAHCQRHLEAICAGPARWRDRHPGRHIGSGSRGALGRTAPRTPTGPPLGNVVEPGADC